VKSGVLLLVTKQRSARDEIVLKAPVVLTSSSNAHKALVHLVDGMVLWGYPLLPGVKPCSTIKIKALKHERLAHQTGTFEVYLERHCRCTNTVPDCCLRSSHHDARGITPNATFYFIEGSLHRNSLSFRELGEFVWLDYLATAGQECTPAQRNRLAELTQKKLLGLASFFEVQS
jgi:hypothetical protein